MSEYESVRINIQPGDMNEAQQRVYDLVRNHLMKDAYMELIKKISQDGEVNKLKTNNGTVFASKAGLTGAEMDAFICAIVDSFGAIMGSLLGALKSQMEPIDDANKLVLTMIELYTGRFARKMGQDLLDFDQLRKSFAEFDKMQKPEQQQ